MLKESLIENHSIALNQTATSWQEAIKIGTDLLVKAGTIEPRYYDHIISNIEKMGPYIILAPGLAMPHARPEHGAKRVGTALVTLEKPLNFGSPDNDPVSVALFLCAPNKDEHIQLLTDIATLFEDEEFLDAAVDFESIDDVQAFLAEHLDEQ